MLKMIKINGTDYMGGKYLSTVCCYLTQEDMDLDIQENTDMRAVHIISNPVLFSEVEGLTQEEIEGYIKTKGEQLFNATETQNILTAIENMPNIEAPKIL